MNGLEEDFQKRALKQMLSDEFLQKMVGMVKTPTKVNYSKRKDKRLSDSIEYFMVKVFAEGWKQSKKELKAIESHFKQRLSEEPTVENIPTEEVVPEQALEWYSTYAIYLTGVVEQAVLDQIQGTVRESINEGLHLKDIVKKLQNDANYEGFAERRLFTIGRTESTKAYNSGRLEQYKNSNGFVQALQYSAILDKRTTPTCRALHGKIMAIDSPEVNVYLPPNHFNCRSLIVPITRYEEWTQDDFSGVHIDDGFDNPLWTPVNKK